MVVLPETKYARSGDVHIAYQVMGNGPIDLVVVPGWVTHVEYNWEEPLALRFFERLAAFCRVIPFDKRGTGLSDRVADKDLPTLEQRMDDVRAVMDAVGSERAALFSVSEGGAMCLLFAATYPERTSGLILFGGYARRNWAPDYPWGDTPETNQQVLESINSGWGSAWGIERRAGSLASDERFRHWYATLYRLGASPGAAMTLYKMNAEIDVRHVLTTIRVPSLILHRAGDRTIQVEHGRFLAAHIPGAKYVELEGIDHIPFVGDADSVIAQIEEFLTGVRPMPEPDRVLSTVLFTDIVDSTRRISEIGDRRWRELLANHDALIRRELARYRGREVGTAGDSFLATFDGPARAVRCALSAGDAVRQLGMEIRAGLHTGEIELMGESVGGMAVHIGARVAALAGASEVLVSSTVKDLVAGSGLQFSDRGVHPLKGVPGEWHLFAVER
jgi:pimeloyl-ACP methyl ester carboxylesterase